MTHHHPYGPDELDRPDAELDSVAHALERYAAESEGTAPADLTGRILAAIDREPDPARGWWASLLAGPRTWRPAGRLAAMAAVAAIAVVGAVALAGILESMRPSVGSSSPPSPLVRPSETSAPSHTPSPTASPSPTPSASPTPSPTLAPTQMPATPVPTASDDDDDDEETPEPGESDNSGPGGGGGGGGDDSGPGGGDEDR